MSNEPIHVTAPALAPLEEYVELLKQIWDSKVLTHNGPMVQELERQLSRKLGVKNGVAVANGTIALQAAIRALELSGEIITTAFSWVATISSIKWEGCTPVLCDIDRDTLNIDPSKIESHISENTVAIMPVHVFGNPCDVDAIGQVAEKYNLKVIYDAAHAVASTVCGKSVMEYGDISATSLHGTKLLNTAEGGMCFTQSQELFEKLQRIRFFGHNQAKDVIEDGLNGKMSEIHAALGIANLKYYDEVLEDRRHKYDFYRTNLSSLPGLSFQSTKNDECNFSYFPAIFESEDLLLETESSLNRAQIFPRRYFYPSLNKLSNILPYSPAPISEDISSRILCLPLYHHMPFQALEETVEVITDVLVGRSSA